MARRCDIQARKADRGGRRLGPWTLRRPSVGPQGGTTEPVNESIQEPTPVNSNAATTTESVLVAVDLESPPEDLSPLLSMAAAAGWTVDLAYGLPAPAGDYNPGPPTVDHQLDQDMDTDWLGAVRPAHNRAVEQLESMAAALGPDSVPMRTHVLHGPPVDALLTAADRLGAAMIVVVGHRTARPGPLGSLITALLKVTDRPVLVLPTGEVGMAPGFVAAVDRLVQLIDREDDADLADLRVVAEAQLSDPASEKKRTNLGRQLVDALHRFETTHPDLTRAINDVSHHLSGMGI